MVGFSTSLQGRRGPEDDLDPSPSPLTQALGIWQKEDQLGCWQEGIAGWGHGVLGEECSGGARCGEC